MLYNLLCVSVFSKHILSNRFIKGKNKTEMHARNKNKIFNEKQMTKLLSLYHYQTRKTSGAYLGLVDTSPTFIRTQTALHKETPAKKKKSMWMSARLSSLQRQSVDMYVYIHGFMLCTGLICTCRKLVKICGTGTGRLNTLQTQRLDMLVHAQHWTDSCSLSLGTVLIYFLKNIFFKPSSKITAGSGTSESLSLTAC